MPDERERSAAAPRAPTAVGAASAPRNVNHPPYSEARFTHPPSLVAWTPRSLHVSLAPMRQEGPYHDAMPPRPGPDLNAWGATVPPACAASARQLHRGHATSNGKPTLVGETHCDDVEIRSSEPVRSRCQSLVKCSTTGHSLSPILEEGARQAQAVRARPLSMMTSRAGTAASRRGGRCAR